MQDVLTIAFGVAIGTLIGHIPDLLRRRRYDRKSIETVLCESSIATRRLEALAKALKVLDARNQ